jgi:hypothetical protein
MQDNNIMEDEGLITAREFTGVRMERTYFVRNNASHLLYAKHESTSGTPQSCIMDL